jgi:small subunit ribosomal protein S17
MEKGKKIISGVVVSDKMQKTVIVEVKEVKRHPKYHKRYTSVKKFAVHVPDGEVKKGDKVEIVEIPPKSKTKRFQILRKIEA